MIYYYDKYSKYISFNKTTSFGFAKTKRAFGRANLCRTLVFLYLRYIGLTSPPKSLYFHETHC